MTSHSTLHPAHPKPEATAMRLRNRLIPVLALLAGAVLVQHADAATTLTVNCTFTISKDVHIVWGGTGLVTGTAAVTWPIGAAVLGQSYSTISQAASGDGTSHWPLADGSTLVITNNSLTADGVVLSVTATSNGTGWAAAASAGANNFVAAVTPLASAPVDTPTLIGTASAKLTPTNASFATVAATASTNPLWFAVTIPSSITTGGNNYQISFAFTGTAQ